ncbi:hypothetical protein [Hydrogenophaga sp. MI9]|uniref:hypothetical protein n=1 Tax=Hydrogenophaga sp. MI9 TaxID=3453719 RepID=UPI003EEDD646
MLMLAVVVALAGCFPHLSELVPEVSGRVVNERGDGLEGLWVGVVDLHGRDGKALPLASTATDKDGGFQFPAATTWRVFFAGQSAYVPNRFGLEIKKGDATVYSSPLMDLGTDDGRLVCWRDLAKWKPLGPNSWRNLEIWLTPQF